MDFSDGGNCTGFPETWYQWYLYKGFIPAWRTIYIGWMCEDHDNNPEEGQEFKGCANTQFFKDTWRTNVVGAVLISTVASIACWVKYFSKQKERV